jgi:hypothetical protein
MKIYDAAFVPCKEPDITTGEFPDHHNRTLERVLELSQEGIVRSIALSGRYATWYDNHGVTPWFGTECDASADYLIKRGCSPETILRDPKSQDSIANFVHSGEDIFVPLGIGNVLVVAAEERLPRLEFLGQKILDGVVDMDFESIGAANDPWLAQKELFTLAIQAKYLEDVPSGQTGWPVLKSWFYTEGMYPFWISFDAAQQAMAPAAEGVSLSIPDIVASMDAERLSPDIMEFATLTARSLAR